MARSAKSCGPHPVDVAVGRRLRACRLAAGLSQDRLAAALGITFQQVQKYESGHNRISASRIWEVCRVLCIPVEALFAGVGQPAPAACPAATEREFADLAASFGGIGDARVRAALRRISRALAAAAA